MRYQRNFVDPVVETRQTLKSFLHHHSFNSENQFVMDSSDYTKNWRPFDAMMIEGMKIYDKQGRALCYQGDSHCDGVILKQLLEGKLDSFSVCDNEMPLDSVLLELNLLQSGEKRYMRDFAETDYYIVEYWQKFRGRKLGYKTGIAYTEKQIAKHENLKVTYLKVNADFLDEWGFTAGEKIKLPIKMNRRGARMDFSRDSVPF